MKWIDSHSQVNNSVTVGLQAAGQLFAFCRRFGAVCIHQAGSLATT